MTTFDLDKLIAANRPKTKTKPFTFTMGGEEYTLPTELDSLALAAINEGGPRANEGLRKILGGDQYDRMLASPVVVTADVLRELFEAYGKHISGVSVGESSASPGSSKSTVKRLSSTSATSGRSASRSSVPKS